MPILHMRSLLVFGTDAAPSTLLLARLIRACYLGWALSFNRLCCSECVRKASRLLGALEMH